MSELGEIPAEYKKEAKNPVVKTEKLPHKRVQLPLLTKALIAGTLGASLLTCGRIAESQRTPQTQKLPDGFSETATPVPETGDQVIPIPEYQELIGEQSALVAMIRERNSEVPITFDEENAIMTEVAKYYHDESYGKLQLIYDTVGWLDTDSELLSSMPEDTARIADALLLNPSNISLNPPGKDLLDYENRIYVINQTGKGAISGHGTKREPYNQVWVYVDEYKDGLRGTLHEMGHAFGLGHVNTLSCEEENDYTNNCIIQEAGGRSNMGGNYGFHIAGPQKLTLGWIKPDQVITLKEDTANLSISSIQSFENTNKLIRIQKPDTGDFYYIEYSVPEFPNNDPTLNFYIWDQQAANDPNQIVAMGNYYSADGETFFDKINGIKVTQISHSESDAIISVDFTNK